MRIIAGSLKGRRLAAPDAGDLTVRPTSDRAREALFSILQAWPEGPFLDLFAGSGAVGLEAWSRGYRPVVLLERHPKALACLRANARGTDVRILSLDVRRGLDACGGDFRIVFADPPYADSLEQFRHLATGLAQRLVPGGLLVWETERRTDLPELPGLRAVDDRTYGTARFRFFSACPG